MNVETKTAFTFVEGCTYTTAYSRMYDYATTDKYKVIRRTPKTITIESLGGFDRGCIYSRQKIRCDKTGNEFIWLYSQPYANGRIEAEYLIQDKPLVEDNPRVFGVNQNYILKFTQWEKEFSLVVKIIKRSAKFVTYISYDARKNEFDYSRPATKKIIVTPEGIETFKYNRYYGCVYATSVCKMN